VGSGLMGSGIAEVAARHGFDVLVSETTPELLAAGRSRLETSLARAQRSGKMDAAAVEEALSRVRFTTDLGDMAERELVVEAIPEIESAKVEVFTLLDRVVQDSDALLASNTSS